MKELRDIKIDLLIGNQNPIIDLFNKITDGINIINCPVYNEDGLEFIYHKDGQWIFYQDSKNEKFWTNYYKYWTLFESNFSLQYLEIQAITKYLVVQSTLCIHKVEETLKREVCTPTSPDVISLIQVEEALKREVSTPLIRTAFVDNVVEDALKREISPPSYKLLQNK